MMNSLKTLGLTAVLVASAAGSVLAQAQTLTITSAPANFQGDSSGVTGQISAAGTAASPKFLDVEGAGNGSFATFGVIDFTGNSVYDPNTGNQEVVASVDPSITLNLTDTTFSQSRPTSLNFYLSDSSAALSTLKYQTSDTSATAGVGNQLGNLYFLGTGFDTSPAPLTTGDGKGSRVGSILPYNLTLSAAAQSYFVQQLNADVNPLAGDPTPANLTNLRLVITSADAANPKGVAAFSGSTGSGAPTLTFTATPVPEPGALVNWGAGLSVVGVVLLTARRRRRA